MDAIRLMIIVPLLLVAAGAQAQIRTEPTSDAPITYSLPPKVVSSVPTAGASDVDPGMSEIRITFDQDMDTGPYSFTDSHLYYPTVKGNAVWLDARTCALPVALAPERFYRVGINTGGSRNFKSATSIVAYQHVVYFTTVGASALDVAALKPPKVVTMRPENGARGVISGQAKVMVVFDQRMLPEFSLVAVDPKKFPQFVGIGTWTSDMRQLTFAVQLDAQKNYILGLNSLDNLTFQNDHGVPLEPINWNFDTIR